MTKKLFIHVGAGKTGTTALQIFFNINRTKLQKEGVTFANIGVVQAGEAITHHKLADWGAHRSTDVMSLWQEIATLNDDQILLSSEYFHSRISENDGVDFFRSIRDLFINREIRIIFYIRRQSEWIQSAHEQWVKANALSLTIEQFAKSYKKNLSDQIFKFAEAFGKENIIVKPYEKKQFKGGSIFTDFFRVLGVDIDDTYNFPKGNINPRLSAEALNFKRVFNSYCRDKKEARIIQADLGKYSELVSNSSANDMQYLQSVLPQKLQKSIEEDNRKKYEEIASEYLGRKNRQLFVEEIKYPSDNQPYLQQCYSSELYPFLFLQMYKKIQNLTKRNEELASRLEHIERNFTEINPVGSQ